MKKLIYYLKPYAILIILPTFLNIIRTVSELYLPSITADMVNIGVINGDSAYIINLGGIMLLIAFIAATVSILANFISSKATNGFIRDLRMRIFSRVENFSLYEFDQFGTASLINRTTNDIAQVRNLVDFGLRMIIIAPVMSIGSILMAYGRDPRLSIIFVVVIPVLAFITIGIVLKGLPLFGFVQNKLDEMNLILRERLSGIRVIRAFNREDVEKKRFHKKNTDYTSMSIHVNRIMGAMMPLVTFTMNLAILSIVWFGGHRILGGHMMVGDLMAFIQYALQVMMAMILFTRIFVIVPKAMASWGRISQILDTQPEIADPLTPRRIIDNHGIVSFQNVSFYYPGSKFPALSDITFQASPGKTTAIIGSTGSGKTTIASLLLRHYDVTAGSITIDKIDIRDMDQQTLRSGIGYAAQNPILFSGTIRENLFWGKENATDEDLMYACQISQANEFIEQLPKGYDYVLSQGARNLSGGQKQRLSIARALIKRAPVLIFDDSFSALDFSTESRLRQALAEETKDRTVIIISQRINTVLNADQILVLEEGRIVGKGKHKELLSNNPVYREIVSSQLSEEDIA